MSLSVSGQLTYLMKRRAKCGYNMKKLDIKHIPSISGGNTRPAIPVQDLADLKVANSRYATYSLRLGDTVVFPRDISETLAFRQLIRSGSDQYQTHIIIERNGLLDWLSVGALCKQDINNEYTCPFTKEIGTFDNDYDRIVHLIGKTIRAVGMKDIEVQAYDRSTGELLTGQKRTQKVPIIEYVDIVSSVSETSAEKEMDREQLEPQTNISDKQKDPEINCLQTHRAKQDNSPIITIGALVNSVTDRPILSPGTPDLFFCAFYSWDFDGPDFGGPPISGIHKSNYGGQPALVLVYSLHDVGVNKTGKDLLSSISLFSLSDEAAVFLMNLDTGKVSQVTKFISFLNMFMFCSEETDCL